MSLERAGFERACTVEPRHVGNWLFLYSEAMRMGLIAERDQYVLPREIVAQAKVAARKARSATRRDSRRSEFVTMIAYKPSASE
jgi:hypothetical protein